MSPKSLHYFSRFYGKGLGVNILFTIGKLLWQQWWWWVQARVDCLCLMT